MAIALNHDPIYLLGPWAGNVMDDYGCEWYVTEEQGWAAGVNARSLIEERENAHGGADAPSYFESRLITLTGEAYAPDRNSARQAKERLIEAVMVEGASYFTVQEGPLRRWCQVRASGAPMVKDIGSRRFSWQFTVRAPDPRRYTDPVVSTATMKQSTTRAGLRFPLRFPLRFNQTLTNIEQGTTRITNEGTAPSWPTFTIAGACPGFIIRHSLSREEITYPEPLAAGDNLMLDSLTGAVLLNGVEDRRSYLQFSTWWSIPARGSVDIQFESTAEQASAVLSASVKSAWW
jgi:hypothetical protein